MTILHLDLASFNAGNDKHRSAVAQIMMQSLETGFVYVAHGLSEDMLDEVYAKLAEFFSLDHATKASYCTPGSFGARGYTGTLVETAAGESRADWKEMINWGVSLPESHPLRRQYPHQYLDAVFPEKHAPGIASILSSFHDTMLELQRQVLHIIALGLGVNPSYFDRMIKDGPSLTRAIHYPSMDLGPDNHHVWAAPHVDINLITALPRATAKGLQLRKEGQWLDVAPPAGHAIINTGIMLEYLTNGIIKAGHHRVVAAGVGERYSVVQFCHPTPWTVLTPIPSCITSWNPLTYSSMTAATALDQVLWDINLKT